MTIDRTSDTAAGERDHPAEHALIAAAAAGDREAFGALVQRHERAAVRAALAALGRQADAEDVTQDAFLIAWQKLPTFRAEASFRTWLLTIVWRQALARRRVRRRWWQRFVTADREGDGRVEARFASPDVSPEQRVVDRERAGAVAAAIARLSPKLRDTLLLAAAGEYGYEQIGCMLGVPVGTVKWRVAEARRQIGMAVGSTRDA